MTAARQASRLIDARSDSDLVRLVRAGDDRAAEVLIDRYRRAARARAGNYFLIGADHDDLVQEAMIGLTKAIRDFDPDHGASFASFAELCITRQILTAIKAATRLKHAPLNTYVSFDRPADESGRTLADTIGAVDEADPLATVLADDDLATLRAAVGDTLSGLEREVLQLYIEGRSYQDIAETLGRHAKAVDNALQRIKKKLEQRLGR